MPTILDADLTNLARAFSEDGNPNPPRATALSARSLFYYLVNVEEHPEILPLAYDLVATQLAEAVAAQTMPAEPRDGEDAIDRLDSALAQLGDGGEPYAKPWRSQSSEIDGHVVRHFLTQYTPTAWVDGCWLQAGMRVATAHTEIGAAISGLYQHQMRAFVADAGRHFIMDYRDVCGRLGDPADDVASHSFVERGDFADESFMLPVLLLAIGQFPRTFGLEILGLNLSWQYLGLGSFAPDLIRDACAAYALPALGTDLTDAAYLQRGRVAARSAALQSLANRQGVPLVDAWRRLMLGLATGRRLWAQWFDSVQRSAPPSQPDPRQEMIELLRRKAPHARGFHGQRALGAHRIDDLLDPQTFDGPAILTALSASPWVKAGRSDKSSLVNRLVNFGGPMLGVFSAGEIEVMRRWIDSLSATETGEGRASEPIATRAQAGEPLLMNGRSWKPAEFRVRSAQRFAKISVRDLYHRLVNIEYFPDVLPCAERFAHERLERSMAMLWKGERPIPSDRYDPHALEAWVYNKHREQVDSYRPPGTLPEAPKDAFIEATVQLAPLILIDGGWLQGMASPALIHTPVARMLLHVLVEELGEGNAAEHHANVYRKLLAAMGIESPPVESAEFAHWQRLLDTSFEVPTLWLSISCFPRHFMPEILGLNLAVELAGVGGPYMEARDTLRRFRLPTTFVDVHNAADNVSQGHSAWAMNAIKRYLDEVAERDGPHNVDRIWHRVWSGVRATLPQIGRSKLVAHRLRQRLLGADTMSIPLIFST